MQSNYIFVIPAYNPSDLLLKLISNLLDRTDSFVYIINDGSSSHSYPVFYKIDSIYKNNSRVFFLQNVINKGKGASLKMAFKHALENVPKIAGIITLDADGQHTISDAIKVLKILQKHKNSFVLGYRTFEKNIPLRSFIGNKISIYLYYLILGKKFKDTQTGLRGLSKKIIKLSLSCSSNRFEFETEQLVKVVKLESEGVRIVETAIKTVYIEDNNSSSFRPVLDSFMIYRVLFRNIIPF